MSEKKLAIITGAAKRVGAETAKTLHGEGYDVLIHCNTSIEAAADLVELLNQARPGSADFIQVNLTQIDMLHRITERALQKWGRIDVLVNNASSFYPTNLLEVTEAQFDDLWLTNCKAPFFLTQLAAPHLKKTAGVLINMVDIHADRPVRDFAPYCSAKAGLVALTKSFAKELAPEVRVNGVAPGAVLWLDQAENIQSTILDKTALKRPGSPEDIAKTIRFLVCDAPYITGQIVNVDGGRTLHQ